MSVTGKENSFLSRVFQAIRMEVNDEMEALKEMLAQMPNILADGGRLVVMSYHSLEDRLVKQFFKYSETECICPPSIMICECTKKGCLDHAFKHGKVFYTLHQKVACGDSKFLSGRLFY